MITIQSTRLSAAPLICSFAVVLVAASGAQASVIVGLIINPTSTAGGGSTSTRSGPGSWQLYAVDDGGDFGISSYSVALANATVINHRSPVTTVIDSNGDPQTAGFSGLRSGTSVNPIVASQGLPGTTPFLIKGLGQTASNFTTKIQEIDPSPIVVGPTTSGSWGTYNNFTIEFADWGHGRNFVFLAEGLWSGIQPSITSALFTVYQNQTGGSIAAPTFIITPEPATLSLFTMSIGGIFGAVRRWRT